jgi:hypothetical protein
MEIAVILAASALVVILVGLHAGACTALFSDSYNSPTSRVERFLKSEFANYESIQNVLGIFFLFLGFIFASTYYLIIFAIEVVKYTRSKLKSKQI